MDEYVKSIIDDVIEKFIKPVFGDEPIPDNCKEMMDAFVKKGGDRDEIDDYLSDVPYEYDYPTYAKCVLELGTRDKVSLFDEIAESALETYEFMRSDLINDGVIEFLVQLDQERCATFLEEHYFDFILRPGLGLDFDLVKDYFGCYISIKGEDALIAYLDNHFASKYDLNSQRDWDINGDSVSDVLLGLLTVTDIPLVVNYVLERYLLISQTTCPVDTIYPYIEDDYVSPDILIEGAISRYTRGAKLIDVLPLLEAAINNNSDKAKSVLEDLCRKEIQSKGPCRNAAKKVISLLGKNKADFETGIKTTEQKKAIRKNIRFFLYEIIFLVVLVVLWILFPKLVGGLVKIVLIFALPWILISLFIYWLFGRE